MSRFDCKADAGVIFYDASQLLAAQGPRGKHLDDVVDPSNPGETMLYPSSPPLDLSKPLETKPLG